MMLAYSGLGSIIQCTLIGDGFVGKTCLAHRFVQKKCPEKYIATVLDKYIGYSFVDGQKFLVSITDFAGQHEYNELREYCYKADEVYVLCYSVADRASFESVKLFWIPEIRKLGRRRPIILVGTQTDLRKRNKDHIKFEEGQELARQIRAECFLECSAYTNEGVRQVFQTAVLSSLRFKRIRTGMSGHMFMTTHTRNLGLWPYRPSIQEPVQELRQSQEQF